MLPADGVAAAADGRSRRDSAPLEVEAWSSPADGAAAGCLARRPALCTDPAGISTHPGPGALKQTHTREDIRGLLTSCWDPAGNLTPTISDNSSLFFCVVTNCFINCAFITMINSSCGQPSVNQLLKGRFCAPLLRQSAWM